VPILRIISGIGEGTDLVLGTQPVTIGRDPRAGLRISDPKSSRSHAEVRNDNGRWMLVDLGSSNGTWSGESRIESMPLSEGFTFRIGKTMIRFEHRFPRDAVGQATAMDTTSPVLLEGLEEGEPSLLAVSGSSVGRTNAYLALLHQIVLKSNAASDRDALFELLDEAAAEALEGDRCAVFLPTADGWALWPAHERRLRARYGAVPFARTLLQAVKQRHAPLLCTRQGDISPSASMVEAGVRSAMAAPVQIGSECDALLYVDRIAGTAPFTRTELEFLAAVANQLAVQLHNRNQVATLEMEVERLQARPAVEQAALVWKDPLMQEVDGFIAKAAIARSPILIRGEPGSGKELVARLVHQRSERAQRPLQIINCAALTDAEVVLFGRFMPNGEPRPGLIELADQGTVYLDDVDALPAAAQALLLVLIDRGEFNRPGDGALRRVDVRIIASTSRDLEDEVFAGRFRADLRPRLDVLGVSVPPLRNRPADIDALADHFLGETARKLQVPVRRLAPEARALLLRYAWPGNVRQLKNAIERAGVVAQAEVIRSQDLPESLRTAEPSPAIGGTITTLAEVERVHIQRVLEHCGGNKKAAAEILGIDRSTLYAKLRQFGHMS